MHFGLFRSLKFVSLKHTFVVERVLKRETTGHYKRFTFGSSQTGCIGRTRRLRFGRTEAEELCSCGALAEDLKGAESLKFDCDLLVLLILCAYLKRCWIAAAQPPSVMMWQSFVQTSNRCSGWNSQMLGFWNDLKFKRQLSASLVTYGYTFLSFSLDLSFSCFFFFVFFVLVSLRDSLDLHHLLVTPMWSSRTSPHHFQCSAFRQRTGHIHVSFRTAWNAWNIWWSTSHFLWVLLILCCRPILESILLPTRGGGVQHAGPELEACIAAGLPSRT